MYETILICEGASQQIFFSNIIQNIKNVIIGDEKGGDDDENYSNKPYSV